MQLTKTLCEESKETGMPPLVLLPAEVTSPVATLLLSSSSCILPRLARAHKQIGASSGSSCSVFHPPS